MVPEFSGQYPWRQRSNCSYHRWVVLTLCACACVCKYVIVYNTIVLYTVVHTTSWSWLNYHIRLTLFVGRTLWLLQRENVYKMAHFCANKHFQIVSYHENLTAFLRCHTYVCMCVWMNTRIHWIWHTTVKLLKKLKMALRDASTASNMYVLWTNVYHRSI